MKQESAVSSVVGVMLMLTITVVIFGAAALVAVSIAGEAETPISAEVTAVKVTENSILFELVSGEPFAVSDVRAVLGVRGDSTRTVSLWGSPHLKGVSGEMIGLGDRFSLAGETTADGMQFDTLQVSHGEYLTYRLYDTTDRPFSSGEIRIP